MADIADAQEHPGAEEEDITPRSDFWQGVGWFVFGVAVLAGSITMDRLESQNINPYTIPGLLPGILGLAMMLLGSVVAIRSWQRGAFAHAPEPFSPHQREVRKRVWTVVVLCAVYSVALIGHGLPFWAASAIFIVGTMLVLQRMDHDPARRRLNPRLMLKAIAIGLIASVVTQAVFQNLFLVRLP